MCVGGGKPEVVTLVSDHAMLLICSQLRFWLQATTSFAVVRAYQSAIYYLDGATNAGLSGVPLAPKMI